MWIAKMRRYSNSLLMFSIVMNRKRVNLIIILKIIKNLVLSNFKSKVLLLRKKSNLKLLHNSNKMWLSKTLRRLHQYKNNQTNNRIINSNQINSFKQLNIKQTDQPLNFKAKMLYKEVIQQQETWTALNQWVEADRR